MTSGGYTNSSQRKLENLEHTSTKKAKGKKVNNLTIENGISAINSRDDSIHANNDITINNGNFDIKSGDAGIHADNNLTINSGEILINSGDATLYTSDDGFNTAGGNDSSSMNRYGANKFSDSNGTIKITNGNIKVEGSTDNGNGL